MMNGLPVRGFLEATRSGTRLNPSRVRMHAVSETPARRAFGQIGSNFIQ